MNLLITGLFLCCGTAAVNGHAKTRIANQGEVASEGEFPYQVSIQVEVRGIQQHICGGSLISRSHVLTAAHCVQKEVDSGGFPVPVSVEVGSARIGQGQRYGVERISYYAGYRGPMSMNIYENDIAMIHLSEPVQTTNRVATINLPAPNATPRPGTPVILSGFGSSYVGSVDAPAPQSPVLKKMDAVIVSRDECNQYYIQALQKYVGSDKVCATRGPGYGACSGDSGGPLVDSTRRTVIGIVSAGDAQCSNGQPDTYTDVSRFISYIDEELNYRSGSGSQNPAINMGSEPNQPLLQPGQAPFGWPEQQNVILYPTNEIFMQQGQYPDGWIE